MNQKWIPVNERALVQGCKNMDREAQRYLYERFAPVFNGIIRRYVRDPFEAEDVLVDAFFRIFTKIGQLQDDNLLVGWMKRVVVNEALMFIRKKKKLRYSELDAVNEPYQQPLAMEKLKEADILILLDKLPVGYRTIFNLYVIEGYKHREIAEKLQISINTSKSQLIMAKRRLREMIESQSVKNTG